MTGLWNPHSFDVGGQPYALSAPPALRAIGGQLTAAQAAMAQDAFARFCAAQRYSLVPNPSESGRLPDGTAYRIDVVGVQAIMQVWPAGTASPAKSGIVVFYEGLGHYLVHYKGSAWSAQPVRSGYFGAGVHAALAGGGYVLSPRDTTNTDVFDAQPTKFNQLSRTGNKTIKQPLLLTGDGYLYEVDPTDLQDDWVPIVHTKNDLTFILFGSGGYNYQALVYRAGGTPSPSGTPTKLLQPVHVSTIASMPSRPRWARQYGQSCIYTQGSGDVLESGLAAFRAARLCASTLPTHLPRSPVASAQRQSIEAVPPYSTATTPIPATYSVARTSSRESKRWESSGRVVNLAIMKSACETPASADPRDEYIGYPAYGELVTNHQWEKQEKSTHSNVESAGGSYWLDDLVDADGNLYSIRATFDADLSLHRELTTLEYATYSTASTTIAGGTTRWRFQLPNGIEEFYGVYARGQWQSPTSSWTNLEVRVATYRNRMVLGLGAPTWSVNTLDVDLQLVDTWTIQGNVRTFALTGAATVRAILAYEEKTSTSVVAELVLEDLSVTRPYSNSTFVDVKAVGKKHLAVYRKGQKVYSVGRGQQNISQVFGIYGQMSWGNAPLGEVGFADVELDLGTMAWASDIGPAADPPGRKYLAAAYPPIDPPPRVLKVFEKVSEGDNAVSEFFFDYEGLIAQLHNAYPTPVRFAHDPQSGGLGVFVHDAGCHVLLAPDDGAATELAQVTGQSNSTLHKNVRSM